MNIIDRKLLATVPEQIADLLAERIEAGEVREGMVDIRALCAELEVSRQSCSRALRLLQQRSLVVVKRSRGSFVLQGGAA